MILATKTSDQTRVCVFSFHLFWTSRRISHPPSFCGACLNFSRDKDSAIPSLVDREKGILCTNGHFFFLVRKNPVYRDSNSCPNVSEGYEVTSELPGRPAF